MNDPLVLGLTILAAAAGLAAIASMILRGRAPAARSSHDRTPPAMTDAHALLEELEKLVGRIDEKVDIRVDELRALLADADRKICDLRRTDRAMRNATGACDARDAAATATPATRPGREAILRLGDQGLSPEQIAEQLGSTDVGEVQLVLNLRRESQNQPN